VGRDDTYRGRVLLVSIDPTVLKRNLCQDWNTAFSDDNNPPSMSKTTLQGPLKIVSIHAAEKSVDLRANYFPLVFRVMMNFMQLRIYYVSKPGRNLK
jgi:hypothetical protein